MRPLVLALDVNETLSEMSPLAARFEHLGVPAHLMVTWFSNTLRDGFALTAAGGYASFATVGRAAAISLLALEQGLSQDVDEAAGYVLAGLDEFGLHGDVRPGLERLRAAGFRIVTLTNGSRSNTKRLLERGGVTGLVEQNLTVDDVERWKPAPEPYQHAVACCGVRPEEMMLVAVHPWDVDGAKRAGLGAAWINRAGLPYPDELLEPDLAVQDFVALAQALSDHTHRA